MVEPLTFPIGTGALVVGGKVVGRITKISIAVASDDGGKVRIKSRRSRIGLSVVDAAGDLRSVVSPPLDLV
jgi:hypothetical protein